MDQLKVIDKWLKLLRLWLFKERKGKAKQLVTDKTNLNIEGPIV